MALILPRPVSTAKGRDGSGEAAERGKKGNQAGTGPEGQRVHREELEEGDPAPFAEKAIPPEVAHRHVVLGRVPFTSRPWRRQARAGIEVPDKTQMGPPRAMHKGR